MRQKRPACFGLSGFGCIWATCPPGTGVVWSAHVVKPAGPSQLGEEGPDCRMKAEAALTLPLHSSISPQADSALLGALIVFSKQFWGNPLPNQAGASLRAPLPHSTGEVP